VAVAHRHTTFYNSRAFELAGKTVFPKQNS
jgi:hypothetical protein